jgi:hypothetical protein
MANKDFQKGFALGFVSSGTFKVQDTSKLDVLNAMIDESGIFESNEFTLMEKVSRLIDMVKNGTIKSFLTSSDGFVLTDINGLYLTPKESD